MWHWVYQGEATDVAIPDVIEQEREKRFRANCMRVRSSAVWAVAAITALAVPGHSGQTLGEKLGYSRDAKLLIVHADDVGVTHSVNAATIKALESGAVNSASIMVPCPWFPEIAEYAKTHPEADFGLHLVLTSERVYYRWGPVAPRDKVPSLVDGNGYFHHDWDQGQRADPKDAETELRAQIQRAMAMGIRPTHFDSHQYRLIGTNKELFEVFLRLAHEFEVPAFVTRDWFAEHPYLEAALRPGDIVVDHTVTIDPSVSPERWNEFYRAALKGLQPGVTEFVIHVGYDDEEMRAFSRERATWGSAWRQRDFDLFTSGEFRELLEQQHIQLITWRELAKAAKAH
jgi:chitin disaccharide deacetylase